MNALSINIGIEHKVKLYSNIRKNLYSSKSMFSYHLVATSLQSQKKQGWRDGGLSVKEEEEKIKWQGSYEMCV